MNAVKELNEIFIETKRLLTAFEEMGLDPPMLPTDALNFSGRSVSETPSPPPQYSNSQGKTTHKIPEKQARTSQI